MTENNVQVVNGDNISDERLIALLTERIKDRQEALQSLKTAYTNLEQTNAQLSVTEQCQSRFLSLIHDQFSDPLYCMILILRALVRAKLYDDDVQSIFEMMFNDALSVNFHMENVSSASNIESGLISAEISYFNLKDVFVSVKSALVHLIESADVHCDLDLDSNISVYQDREKLEAILRNALSNAIRFSPRSSKISAIVRKLDEHSLEIVISNPGNDIADKDAIFDAFFQEDSSYSRMHHGLGLGLAVVKGYVSFMYGEVEMTRVGENNQLYILLPLLSNEYENFERFSPDDKESFTFDEEDEPQGSF